MRTATLILAAGVLALADSSQAATVYDNGFYDASISAPVSHQGGVEVANEFVLAEDSVIDSVIFWGAHNAVPSPLAFTTTIYADAGPTPDLNTIIGTTSLTEVQVASTGQSLTTGQSVYVYLMSLDTPITVSGGDTHWFSVVGTNASTFYWTTSSNPLNDAYQWDPTGPYEASRDGVAFALGGNPVPEPGSLILVLSGAAALGIRRSPPPRRIVQ